MKKGIAVALLIIGVIGWLIHCFTGVTRSMEASAKADSTAYSKTIPSDYLQLIRDTTKLSFDSTITNKTRNPIVQFFYGKKYYVSIYKIYNYNNVRSLKIITIRNSADEHRTYNITYRPLESFDSYEISYKSGIQDTLTNIYLDFNGSEISTIKNNDTLGYFYSKPNSFSIRYQLNSAQDFFIGSPNEDPRIKIPMEAMIVRRNRAFYFILLTAKDLGTEVTPGMLFNLINE